MSPSSKALSYTTKSISFNIPVGSDNDFSISTFLLFFTYVGHAPFFINSNFPSYKSRIATSNVAYISSSPVADKVEFISLKELSFSNPEDNNFSSIAIAVLLAFLASFPEPFPSLIASKYLPSSSFVCKDVSPDILEPAFVVRAIPICKLCLSSVTYVNAQIVLLLLKPHSCFCNTICSPKTLLINFPIFLTSQGFFSTSSHVFVYNVACILPLSSFFIEIFSIFIFFSSNKHFICSFSSVNSSFLFSSISSASAPNALETSSSWFETAFLFSSSFFFHIKFNLLTLYASLNAFTICSISSCTTSFI